MAEYSIYPFKYINITQSHEGIRSHKYHWYNAKDCSDKPWDEANKDSGRQYFEPQNDYKIVEIGGIGSSITNYVRLETVNKVIIPYHTEPVILEVTLTHMNDADLKQYKVGQICKAGGKYFLEGKDGADAYHWHCTANIGKYYGLKKNSNGAWCFVYDKSLTPEQAFYIDDSITIINPRGYEFKKVPNILQYRVYQDGIGWSSWMSSGIAGTIGKTKPITKLQFKSDNEIIANIHFSYVGWINEGAVNNGKELEYNNYGLECLQLKGNFNYRVHISYYGWTNWTNADGICTLGSVGYGYHIEAIDIRVV